MTEYQQAKNRIYSRAIAQDVMMSLDFVGSWVKDENFRFLEISEKTAQLLFNKTSNECIGRTDFEIAIEAGLKMSKKQFAEICRASDLYLTDDKPKIFIEFLNDTAGGKHIWRTIKCTKKITGKTYYYGFAYFCDVIKGYDQAMKDFRKERFIKINDNLYLES